MLNRNSVDKEVFQMKSLDIKLLPHQYDVIADVDTKIIGLVSGY